jgi:hypothetical protein
VLSAHDPATTGADKPLALIALRVNVIVATFSSQSEAERLTGTPNTVEAQQIISLPVQCAAKLDYSKSSNVVPVNQLRLLSNLMQCL